MQMVPKKLGVLHFIVTQAYIFLTHKTMCTLLENSLMSANKKRICYRTLLLHPDMRLIFIALQYPFILNKCSCFGKNISVFTGNV